MLRGYRLLIAATCGIAILVALGTGAYFGSLYGPNHKQYQAVAGNQDGQNDYTGPSQSLPDIAGLPGTIERAIANPNPTTGEDHEKRDLAAQEASALWAFWMFVVSGVSVVVTSLGMLLLFFQIKLTREAVEETGKATKAMEKQNEIAHQADRAFLYLVPRLSKGATKFKISFENKGRTPANVLGCFVSEFPQLPPAKGGFGKLTDFGLSMDMIVAPAGEKTTFSNEEVPKEQVIRIEILYMDVFGGKCRTLGFFEAVGRSWVLKNNTGWIDMT